ncbi:MAG: AMP-binding protein [Actinomycetota bacterium]
MAQPTAPTLDWQTLAASLSGPAVGGLNIAHAALDRPLAAGRGEAVAVRTPGRNGRSITYAELADQAARVATVLRDLGVRPGDAVAVLLGRVAELPAVALGIWKAGAVFCPLFPTLGPGPIEARLKLAGVRVLVADAGLYARRVAPLRAGLPELGHVLLVGEGAGADGLAARMEAAQPLAACAATGPDDAAILHFTSGTSGAPKAVVHGHRVLLAQVASERAVFALKADDVFWCTADAGWAASTYGLVVPLVAGCTMVLDEAAVDARRWYSILRDEGVTAWYTTPTAIRVMMRHGAALARSYPANRLRVAASIGEPLDAEAVAWGEKALGVPFLDTWWQTETGAVTIANLSGDHRRPGSLGRPLPGATVAVVERGAGGFAELPADRPGELAIRTDWAGLFSCYLGDEGRTRACHADGWYLTGDLARRDADGFVWFLGRADDMIKSGAHHIGPFEIEAALMSHPAVAEAGVCARPDPVLREVPVAFVVPAPGFDAGEALRRELEAYSRRLLGPAMAPRELIFVEALPKTASGKMVRRILKARAADPGEVDLPALEPCPGLFEQE